MGAQVLRIQEIMPRILGWDGAGEVVVVGSDCTLFEKADTVY